MKYYLDTNIIIYALKNTYPSIWEHIRRIPSQSIVIPAVVLAEIEYGARKSTDYTKTVNTYREFTKVFPAEGFSGDAVVHYGTIRSELEKRGETIGPNDLMIAATVLANDGILVTHNVREFSRINGLKIEDWTTV